MSGWKCLAVSALIAGMAPMAASAEPIPVRGIVEGFYGTPWTQAHRLDMLEFCGTHGLNAYIYAPKDDSYHRAKWREPYPEGKRKELSLLVHEELSKITLATGADYARDPEAYDPQESWERALKEQYGSLSRDMELFAGQSQHMENSWAKAGRQDGAELRASMDALWKSWPDGESSDADWEKVYGQVEELHAASGNLLHSLPMHVLEECRPQLMQMQRIAEADRTALELMKSVRAGDERKSGRLISVLEKKRGEIVRKERKAMISEKTTRAFLDEVLAYAADRKREST